MDYDETHAEELHEAVARAKELQSQVDRLAPERVAGLSELVSLRERIEEMEQDQIDEQMRYRLRVTELEDVIASQDLRYEQMKQEFTAFVQGSAAGTYDLRAQLRAAQEERDALRDRLDHADEWPERGFAEDVMGPVDDGGP